MPKLEVVLETNKRLRKQNAAIRLKNTELWAELVALQVDLAAVRASHGKLCRAIKNRLGISHWPTIKGNFTDGVVRLLTGK